MEQFEYNGIWWLPSEPKKQISGILKFHPIKGINLDLIGAFGELRDFGKVREEQIILGITSNGKIVTLYKCFESKTHLSSPGFHSSSYMAQIIFLGHHFGKPDEITFDEFSINYYFLEKWAGITGFTFEHKAGEKGQLEKEVVTYSFPDDVVAKVGDLTIALTSRFSSGGERPKEVRMTHTTLFKVTSRRPITFETFDRKIN